MVNGKSLKGRDDFFRYYGNIYPNLYKSFNTGRSFPTEIRFISPDVVVVHEFVMFGFKDLSSVKGSRTSHNTILLTRKSGQWLVNSAQTVLLHGTKATVAEYAMMPYPKSLNYTKEHLWIKLEGNTATLGLTDYAQETLRNIVFVNVLKIGALVIKNKPFGGLESLGSWMDMKAPFSGKVIATNDSLRGSPESINQNPHSAWIIRIEVSNPNELSGMILADQYESNIINDLSRELEEKADWSKIDDDWM